MLPAGVFSSSTPEKPASSSSVQLHSGGVRASTFKPDAASSRGSEVDFVGLTHSSGRLPRTPTRNRAGCSPAPGPCRSPSTLEHVLADAAGRGRVAEEQAAGAGGHGLRARGDRLTAAEQLVGDRLPAAANRSRR